MALRLGATGWEHRQYCPYSAWVNETQDKEAQAGIGRHFGRWHASIRGCCPPFCRVEHSSLVLSETFATQ